MKKAVVIILVVLLLLLFAKCVNGDDEVDVGATIDWGPGKYWDSNEHTVKDTYWK